MNRILRKDPIVEAICAFQFESSDWDWTVPGLLWGQLREEFPLKQQFDLVAPETPEDSDETLGVSQLNFWRADKTALVRTQPNELGIVQRSPYVGWPSFKATIERVFKAYKDVGPPSELEGISLRYVNILPLPEGRIDLEKYLRVYPRVPVKGDVPLGRWMQQAEVVMSEEEILLSFRVGCSAPNAENPVDLKTIIDITASDFSEHSMGGAESQWLDNAHRQIEELFFACLKPPYLELLQLEEENENVNT